MKGLHVCWDPGPAKSESGTELKSEIGVNDFTRLDISSRAENRISEKKKLRDGEINLLPFRDIRHLTPFPLFFFFY